MDSLHFDELTVIAKRIAEESVRQLLLFMRVSKYHQSIANEGEVLRNISFDQVQYLFHANHNSLGGKFMQKLICINTKKPKLMF